MKKILLALSLFLIFLTGCGVNLEEQYKKMEIGKEIDSYQLDLRIYGTFDNMKINEMYKIDNYKNKEFKIQTKEATYYIVNDILYKEVNTDDNKNNKVPHLSEEKNIVSYEKTNDNVFKETDILLQGLNNIKSKKEIDNDITALELEVYSIKIKDEYIKSLLKKLGYADKFEKASGKVYLQNENLYKLVCKIDDLTINATFLKVNDIKEINIDFDK